MSATTHDARSLTLPKLRGLTRWRPRRPRKPSPAEIWFLGWTVYSGEQTVQDFLGGQLVNSLLSLIICGMYWTIYHRVRRGLFPTLTPPIIAGLIAVSVAWILVGSHL